MKKYIKYEKLVDELKNEIEQYYHNLKKSEHVELSDAIDLWFSNEFDGWLLKKYYINKKDNLRKHLRLDVQLPIKIVEVLIETSEEEKEAIELVGTLINISKGGLYFISNKPFAPSSVIKVKIDLNTYDNEFDTIEALAMVVRVEKKGEQYGIGLMFSSFYDDGEYNINTFILKNLSYYLYT